MTQAELLVIITKVIRNKFQDMNVEEALEIAYAILEAIKNQKIVKDVNEDLKKLFSEG